MDGKLELYELAICNGKIDCYRNGEIPKDHGHQF